MCIGLVCKLWRIRAGIKAIDVANATGYSSATITAFESGNNNNMYLLLWYIKLGMPIDEIMEEFNKCHD